jgi:hypothetical protein
LAGHPNQQTEAATNPLKNRVVSKINTGHLEVVLAKLQQQGG